MVTQFPYHQLDSSESEKPLSHSLDEMLNEFQNRDQCTDLHGMQYYPDVFKYCIDQFDDAIKRGKVNLFMDQGAWMSFLPSVLRLELEKELVEVIDWNDTDNRWISFKMIPIRKQEKILLSVKIRPFYDIEFLSSCLELLHQIINKVYSAHPGLSKRLTFFFKPSILQINSNASRMARFSYMLKKSIIVS